MLGTGRTRTTADIPVVSGSRPVMLATFDVPFEPEATELAVDAAVESGQRLIIVNVAEIALAAASPSRCSTSTSGTQEVEDALRAPAELAHSLGGRRRAAAALQPAAGRRRCSSSSPSARRASSSSGPIASG